MDPWLVVLVGALALALGAAAGALLGRRAARAGAGGPPPQVAAPEPAPSSMAPTLEALPTGVVLVRGDGEIEIANAAAAELGLLDRPGVLSRQVELQARATAQDGRTRDARSGPAPGRPLRARPLGARPPEARPEAGRPEAPRGSVEVRTVLLDGSGTVAVLATDLSDAARAEQVRRDFVANVGHELKTPVGALSLLSEAVVAAAEDPEAVRRFAVRMQHEAERLARLVSEVIELSRIQGAEPLPAFGPVAVDEVVAEAIDRTSLRARAAGVTIEVGGQPDIMVCASEQQLATALGNLIDNAVAYSGAGTRVAVTRAVRGEMLELTVSDRGIGIAAEDRERIFERFYRVDAARSRATGGTGLGLSIVQQIARNHGGSVTVWSTPGVGSTFTVRVPVSGRAARRAREDLAAATTPPGGGTVERTSE